MAELTLEALAERVAILEKEMARIRQPQQAAPRTRDWRRTVGMFAGDEVMKEIFEAGRQIRDAEGPESQE